jgi:hypothetical protein
MFIIDGVFFKKNFFLIIELFMMKYNYNIIGPKLLTFVYKIWSSVEYNTNVYYRI